MSAVERAADIIAQFQREQWATVLSRKAAVAEAEALIDAGLLVTDADRAVLDAVRRWVDGEIDWPEVADAERARREAQR